MPDSRDTFGEMMRTELNRCRAPFAVGCALLAVVFLPSEMSADRPSPPAVQKYESENKRFILEIIPRGLGSPGDDYCKGILYKLRHDHTYSQEWERRLVNRDAPVLALVSNSGGYVVTLDDWYYPGYGKNTIVIYGPYGKLVAQRALEDVLSVDELSKLPLTSSARLWRGKALLEEGADLLVLKIVANGELPWDIRATFFDLKLELRTGDVIGR